MSDNSILGNIQIAKFHTLRTKASGTTIQYRPFLVKEEKLFLMLEDELDSYTQSMGILRILDGCAKLPKGVSLKRLPLADLEELVINLRIQSRGNVSTIGHTCTKCEVLSDTDIHIDKYVVENVTPSDIKNMIDFGPFGVELHPISFGDLTEILHSTDAKTAEEVDNSDPYQQMDMTMKSVVASIKTVFTPDTVYQASDFSEQEVMDFVDNLTSAQFDILTGAVEVQPTLVISQQVVCPSCEHVDNIRIQGISDFLG